MVRTPDLRLLLSGTGTKRAPLVKANGRAGVTGHVGIVRVQVSFLTTHQAFDKPSVVFR